MTKNTMLEGLVLYNWLQDYELRQRRKDRGGPVGQNRVHNTPAQTYGEADHG